MSKIYCSVYNGLGNQLFCYALGIYMSKKYNKELNVDLTKLNVINFLSKIGIKKDTQRDYELNKLGFIHPIKQFNYIEFIRRYNLLNKKQYAIVDYRVNCPTTKKEFAKNIYTIGWGKLNIIKDVLPEMQNNLQPNFERTHEYNRILELIKTKNSVALHIRRGDYLDSKIGKRFNGICTEDYYENAINYMKDHLHNPFFFIFSDDVDYAKEHYELCNTIIVPRNAGYADLFLMSRCKHFILSNSTYSFWAALLSKLTDKFVCVPKYWYNNPLEKESYIPKEWIKIEI